MTTITRYLAQYSKTSSVITKVDLDSTFNPPRNKEELYAKSWDEAHNFLVEKAKANAKKAFDMHVTALKHLAAVLAMRNLERAPSPKAPNAPTNQEGASTSSENTEIVTGPTPDGWFDVDAYSTKELWEGPDTADDGLDGFNTLDAAIQHAKSDTYKNCYQVSVVACGQHAEYEPGERVYARFNHSVASTQK